MTEGVQGSGAEDPITDDAVHRPIIKSAAIGQEGNLADILRV